jgi:integrase
MSKRTNTAVWLEKYSRWQILVQKDNKRKCFTSYIPGRAGQRECNKKADDFLDNNVTERGIKVAKATDEYIEQLKLTTSQGHWKQYEYYYRAFVKPEIGNKKVENLCENDFQLVISKAFAKGMSKKTLKNIKSAMRAWLKFCRSKNYTALFVENIDIPKSAKTNKKRILQPSDINILFSKTNTLLFQKESFDIYVYAYRFEVITGLRPGELIGLRWSDIKNDVVNLERAINVNNELTTGKNENAQRSFKLTKSAKSILEQQKNLQNELDIQSEYVFTNKYGEALHEKCYYERWCKYRDYNNISVPCSLYELRHTFVSMVKRLPEGYLKEVVGHSKDMDTYGVYSHSFADDKTAVADLIQAIIDDIIDVETV